MHNLSVQMSAFRYTFSNILARQGSQAHLEFGGMIDAVLMKLNLTPFFLHTQVPFISAKQSNDFIYINDGTVLFFARTSTPSMPLSFSYVLHTDILTIFVDAMKGEHLKIFEYLPHCGYAHAWIPQTLQVKSIGIKGKDEDVVEDTDQERYVNTDIIINERSTLVKVSYMASRHFWGLSAFCDFSQGAKVEDMAKFSNTFSNDYQIRIANEAIHGTSV